MQFTLSNIVLTLAASASVFASKKENSSVKAISSSHEISTSFTCSPIYITVTHSEAQSSYSVPVSSSAASNVITTVVGGETQTHTINSASTAEAAADFIRPAGIAAAIGFAALLI